MSPALNEVLRYSALNAVAQSNHATEYGQFLPGTARYAVHILDWHHPSPLLYLVMQKEKSVPRRWIPINPNTDVASNNHFVLQFLGYIYQ